MIKASMRGGKIASIKFGRRAVDQEAVLTIAWGGPLQLLEGRQAAAGEGRRATTNLLFLTTLYKI